MSAGAARALVPPAAHLAAPLLISWCARRSGQSGLRAGIGRHPERAYEASTVGIAALSLLLTAPPPRRGPLVGGLALGLGVALPPAYRLYRRGGAVQAPKPGVVARLGAMALCEELIWRANGEALSRRWGGLLPLPTAVAFAAMHLPLHGRARLPYLAAVGTALGASYRCGGIATSSLGHWLHNLVIDLSTGDPSVSTVQVARQPSAEWV